MYARAARKRSGAHHAKYPAQHTSAQATFVIGGIGVFAVLAVVTMMLRREIVRS